MHDLWRVKIKPSKKWQRLSRNPRMSQRHARLGFPPGVSRRPWERAGVPATLPRLCGSAGVSAAPEAQTSYERVLPSGWHAADSGRHGLCGEGGEAKCLNLLVSSAFQRIATVLHRHRRTPSAACLGRGRSHSRAAPEQVLSLLCTSGVPLPRAFYSKSFF